MPPAFPRVVAGPTYSIAEAAHYLQIPTTTLRVWVRGCRDPRKRDLSEYRQPLIEPPNNEWPRLSFTNLVEVHVLDGIRREHPQKMRATITFLRNRTGVEHPLAVHSMASDLADLFEQSAQMMNLSNARRRSLNATLNAYARRVDWNEAGFAIRLYPFTRKRELDEPKAVVIDPEVSFGKPVLVGTGIPTATIAERYKAGESVDELAEDYDLKRIQIEDAIRCELAAN